jgi:hypothetical protein
MHALPYHIDSATGIAGRHGLVTLVVSLAAQFERWRPLVDYRSDALRPGQPPTDQSRALATGSYRTFGPTTFTRSPTPVRSPR